MKRMIITVLALVALPLAIATWAGACATASELDGGGGGDNGGGGQDTGGGNPCDGVDCSGHGTCKESGGSATCECDQGYKASGTTCVSESNPCDGVDCSGHGSCADNAGTATCTCDSGYHADGLTCVEDVTDGGVTDAGEEDGAQGDGGLTDVSHGDGGLADVSHGDGGHMDASHGDAGSQDTGGGEWPPGSPWFSGTTCNLPTCDENGTPTYDVTGNWEQSITTVSHTCSKTLEQYDNRLKPGNVATSTVGFTQKGECVYYTTDTTKVVGVIKGDIMITCEVSNESMGVVVVITSTTTFSGGTGTGQTTGHLNNVPLPPATCEVQYDTTYTKK